MISDIMKAIKFETVTILNAETRVIDPRLLKPALSHIRAGALTIDDCPDDIVFRTIELAAGLEDDISEGEVDLRCVDQYY